MIELQTDYLIVGSGAVGMAFADILVSESQASLIIVDQHAHPGGHWNMAYPFVKLHQPSAFYGVSSVELSKGRKDTIGWNKGLNDLASGAEILAYYNDVMRYQLLPSGRVQYFPLCDYHDNGIFESRLTGATYSVAVNKKIVDATYLKTTIPATHTPNFKVSDRVHFIPLNDLPLLSAKPEGYVIIGGGKTGIDACLWLLEHKVDPSDITWIVSRDAWLLDRRNTQPGIDFFEYSMGALADQLEAIIQAESIYNLFDLLEDKGVLLRIDRSVRPTMFHGATVSQEELEQLRRLNNVVRKGKVIEITPEDVHLENGRIRTPPGVVYVDCSASAISNLEIKPIFEQSLITPQTVRSYQPVFSAAFIAHVEVAYDTVEKKNAISQVVPLPNHDTDWLRMLSVQMLNQYNWGRDNKLRQWLQNNRLDGFASMIATIDPKNQAYMSILQRMRDGGMPAAIKLQQLLAQLES